MSLLPTHNNKISENSPQHRKLHYLVPFLNALVWIMNVTMFCYHSVKGDIIKVAQKYSNLIAPVDGVYFVWIFVFCAQLALVIYGFFKHPRSSSTLQRGVCLTFAIQGALFFAWYFTFSHSIMTSSTVLIGLATRMVWASFFRVYVHIFSPQSINRYCGKVLKKNWIGVTTESCKKDVFFILIPLVTSAAWYTVLTVIHVNMMIVRYLPNNNVAQTACAIATLVLLASISSRLVCALKISDFMTPTVFAIYAMGAMLRCRDSFVEPSMVWCPIFLREALYYVFMVLTALFAWEALYALVVSLFCNRLENIGRYANGEMTGTSKEAQPSSLVVDGSFEEIPITV